MELSYIFSKQGSSYISGNRNPEKIPYISGNRFPSSKNKKKLTLEKFLTFQEMQISSPKLKKLLIFQERAYKAPKTNKKSALKKFLVSCDLFAIFAAVKHKEILSENSLGKFPVNQI